MPARGGGEQELRARLRRMDGRSFGAYKSLRGAYEVQHATLFVDHVQGDPFAAPSRLRLRATRAATGWPAALTGNRVRRVAFADFLARRAAAVLRRRTGLRARTRGSGKSGLVRVDAGQQAVLERNAAHIGDGFIELRLAVGLPAAGRRILADEAQALLTDELPQLAKAVLYARDETIQQATLHANCAENHAHLQRALAERGLVAFIPDGAVLPRESGASERVMPQGARAFESPPSLRVRFEVPHAQDGVREVSGMGVPEGVTLIVGGGYHGKSTLLRALERAVHPHIPGDGREGVATLAAAVKVRAEEGRRVTSCDISGFISALPNGRDTHAFHSDDASGSTSQAAGIVEAIEVGAKLLLLDEDTSAGNFMLRDARMQALVAHEHEPITPFVDRVRELYENLGVSTILVMGGTGDYFEAADTVIEMRNYQAQDVTARAKRIASEMESRRRRWVRAPLERGLKPRVPKAASLDPARGRRRVGIEARNCAELRFGESAIALHGVEQLIEPSQVRAIGFALAEARRFMGPDRSLPEVLDALDAWLDEAGLDALDTRADLARPRRFEIAAALSRLRTLQVESATFDERETKE